MAGMNGIVFAGTSPAGRRLYEAGLAFQRAQEATKIVPPPPEPEEPEQPPPPPLTGMDRVKFEALRTRIQAALDCREGEAPKPLTLATIIDSVAVAFGISPDLLRGPNRKHDYMAPRHMAFLLCHELTWYGSVMIGRMFGGRDHSTILSGIKTIKARMAEDEELAGKYADLRSFLKSDAA